MVKSFLGLLHTRQTTILSGATILMVAVFLSRFLGLIRDRLLVHNFSTSEASIFFAAFGFPDKLFQILILGTLSVAFIPVFTEYLNKEGEKQAFAFSSNILNLALLVFGFFCLLGIIFVGPINNVMIPGFEGQQKILTDQLTRLILVAQFILVIGTFFIGIGQSYQRFLIPALAPLFYNLGIIFGIAVLSPYTGILGPAIGVIIGAVLHVAIQIPLIRALGYTYQFSLDFLNKGVREIFQLMSVRSIGLAAEQMSDAIGLALASIVSTSAIAQLTLAQHLSAVPVGLFGATIAQAALPVLAREHAKGEVGGFKITLLTTMHQILFLTLPATAMLVVLRIPIVRLVFGASEFNWEDTVLTGRTVAFLALGLVAYSLTLLLVRGFYAIKDTKTPVIVSLITVLVNIGLSFWFVRGLQLQVWSLGLAYSVSTIVSMVLLLIFLDRRMGKFDRRALIMPALKMFLAAVAAALALYIPIKLLDQLVFDTTKTVNLFILTSIASAFGLSIYLLLVWMMEVKELNTYVELIKKAGKMKFKNEEIMNETGSS